jgi:chromosome partitioning protein
MAAKVAVYSLKGGTGKTTLTLALAGAAAGRGLRVLVADADPHPRAAQFLRNGQKPALGEILPGAEVWYGVRTMRWAGGALPEAPDLVLIDCPPDERGAGPATRAADLALIPVQPERFALEGLAEAAAALPKALTVRAVLNMYDHRQAEHRARADEVRRALGERLWEPPVPARAAIPRAQGTGMPLHLAPSKGLADVVAVVDGLLDRLIGHLALGEVSA